MANLHIQTNTFGIEVEVIALYAALAVARADADANGKSHRQVPDGKVSSSNIYGRKAILYAKPR